MGDTAAGTLRVETSEQSDDAASRETSTFQCPTCGALRESTAIRYDQLGYAICPACSYAAGA